MLQVLSDGTYRGLHQQLLRPPNRRALKNGDPCLSALAEHAINHHQYIAWENMTVVDAVPHMYRC